MSAVAVDLSVMKQSPANTTTSVQYSASTSLIDGPASLGGQELVEDMAAGRVSAHRVLIVLREARERYIDDEVRRLLTAHYALNRRRESV
jgi:hypothetical protein